MDLIVSLRLTHTHTHVGGDASVPSYISMVVRALPMHDGNFQFMTCCC